MLFSCKNGVISSPLLNYIRKATKRLSCELEEISDLQLRQEGWKIRPTNQNTHHDHIHFNPKVLRSSALHKNAKS